MTDRNSKNRNFGERSSNRHGINSSVNNNEQYNEDDFQNQVDDDEVEICFSLNSNLIEYH